jgi:hypothetical protein
MNARKDLQEKAELVKTMGEIGRDRVRDQVRGRPRPIACQISIDKRPRNSLRCYEDRRGHPLRARSTSAERHEEHAQRALPKLDRRCRPPLDDGRSRPKEPLQRARDSAYQLVFMTAEREDQAMGVRSIRRSRDMPLGAVHAEEPA